jgi:hypothetical protein
MLNFFRFTRELLKMCPSLQMMVAELPSLP